MTLDTRILKNLDLVIDTKKQQRRQYFTEAFQLTLVSEAVDKIKANPTDGNFFSFIHTLACEIYQFGVYKRIVEDDPKYLADGIYTYGRLSYLARRNFSEDMPSTSTFIWDMLLGASVNDTKLFDAYAGYHAAPFKRTGNHGTTRTVANLLYLIVFDVPNKEEIETQVNMVLEKNKLSNFDTCFLLTLKGIYTKNTQMFSENLERVVKKSWAMRDNSPIPVILSKGIPIYGHALYALMQNQFGKSDISIPPQPTDSYWDTDFAEYRAGEHTPEFLFDVSLISKNLSTWMQSLPQEFDIAAI